MLTKRLIPVLTFFREQLHRSKHFTPDHTQHAHPVSFNVADEIVLIDVTHPREGLRQEFLDQIVHRFADTCFAPVTVAGSIESVDDVRMALLAGADKVLLAGSLLERPDRPVQRLSQRYGASTLTIGVTAVERLSYDADVARAAMLAEAVAQAQEAEAQGAGEILLQSKARDGSLQGYDLPLLRAVSHAVSVPVIACSGAGSWQHLVDGLEAGADAVATSNIYHFSDAVLSGLKAKCAENGWPMRPTVEAA